MHFLSESFLLFALAFGVLFFLLDGLGQKVLLLVGSYYFCGSQSWLFAALLAVSTLMNYGAGVVIHESEKWRHTAMWAGIVANVALLGVFKYFNFFSESFSQGLGAFGVHYSPAVLKLAIPLGLSFYTLQGISYLVDLREGKVERAGFLDYAVYASFWPKFVAGPIIRARSFLPQLRSRRRFQWANFYLGVESIIYGLFLKTTLSDYLAPQVNKVYASPEAYGAADAMLATVFFTFQVYGDFAGYSLVVIGIARIFGYSVRPNFRRPLFATSIVDFWTRWHISLSSWLRDYVFRRLPVAQGEQREWRDVSDIYATILHVPHVEPDQTFDGLGGDSLAFVQVSLALEQLLGDVPDDWESKTVARLDELKPAPQGF
ncbi:MAG TPA: MBOAT family O-acyltransferase [Micropepsaceae bacterium]|jgi:D-alanyl-lipoteichoic acid acyltransferase DltB (MBOAT superfamily)|nr:MBOAT family O-acyltransferase [Micropepsaceae bacterium]